jgi:hypothetical protein
MSRNLSSQEESGAHCRHVSGQAHSRSPDSMLSAAYTLILKGSLSNSCASRLPAQAC